MELVSCRTTKSTMEPTWVRSPTPLGTPELPGGAHQRSQHRLRPPSDKWRGVKVALQFRPLGTPELPGGADITIIHQLLFSFSSISRLLLLNISTKQSAQGLHYHQQGCPGAHVLVGVSRKQGVSVEPYVDVLASTNSPCIAAGMMYT